MLLFMFKRIKFGLSHFIVLENFNLLKTLQNSIKSWKRSRPLNNLYITERNFIKITFSF